MTKQEVRKIERLQCKACDLLNELQSKKLIGDYEAQVYTMDILFELSPETANEDLTKFILQFERML